MSRIAKRTITGNANVEYSFNVYEYPTNFKSLGGVYVLSKRYEKDGKFYHKDLYVGITEDMDDRHTGHEKEDDFFDNNATAISFHREENENKRDFIEEDILANGQKWPLNIQRS